MSILEIGWTIFLFLGGVLAGFLIGNFFGESRAEEERYSYLSGGKK